jgi:hypothetical protein
LPHQTSVATLPAGQIGINGYPFQLPPPSAFGPMVATRPEGAAPDLYLAQMFKIVFMGLLFPFPDGIRWSDVQAACRDAGWPDDALRMVIEDANTYGVLVGPHAVNGVEILQLGPNYPRETYRPILERAIPAMPVQ